MLSKTFDEAVCIRQADWSETSQTVTLFCRKLGLVRGLAKGTRRERSPYCGGFEGLTLGEVEFITKPTGLANITGWDLREPFGAIRHSLKAFYAGVFMADLVQHAITDADPHPRLYEAMVIALHELCQGDQRTIDLTVLRFQWATLVETGYQPELWNDLTTGQRLDQAATFGFDPRLGGLVTDPQDAASGGDGGDGGRWGQGVLVWRVRSATIELLREIGAEPIGAAPDGVTGTVSISPDDALIDQVVMRAIRLLDAYMREILGREIPSSRVFQGLPPSTSVSDDRE